MGYYEIGTKKGFAPNVTHLPEALVEFGRAVERTEEESGPLKIVGLEQVIGPLYPSQIIVACTDRDASLRTAHVWLRWMED